MGRVHVSIYEAVAQVGTARHVCIFLYQGDLS